MPWKVGLRPFPPTHCRCVLLGPATQRGCPRRAAKQRRHASDVADGSPFRSAPLDHPYVLKQNMVMKTVLGVSIGGILCVLALVFSLYVLHASACLLHPPHMAQMAARGRRRYELRVEMRGAAASKSELRGVQLLSNEVPSIATAHSEVARRRPLWEWDALRTLPDRAFTAGAHRARAEAHRDLIGACRRAARAAPRRAIAQRCMTMRCRRIRRSMTGSERCVGVAQGSQTAMRHSTFTTLRRRAGRAAAPRSHGAPL